MKVALITGSNTGIGYETALKLAREGYRVLAGMRTLAKGAELRGAAAAEGLPIETIAIDCNSSTSMDTAVGAVLTEYGRIDVLVNNAGISGSGGPVEFVSEDDLRGVMETNFFGAYRMMQLVIPGMRERGEGAIVNVTSLAGFCGGPAQSAYCASKFALEGASRCLAGEVGRLGIRVACVEPGAIITPIWDKITPVPDALMQPPFPYHNAIRRLRSLIGRMLKQAAPATAVAEAIHEAITADTPREQYRVGADAESIWNALKTTPLEELTAIHALDDDEAYMRAMCDKLGLEI